MNHSELPESAPSRGGPAPGGGASAPTLRELLPQHLPQIETYVRRMLSRTLRDRESATDLVGSVCGDLLAEGIAFEYRGAGEFQCWLLAVVTNKIRARLRFVRAAKRGHDRQVGATDSQVEGAHLDRVTPAHHAMQREDLGLLDCALARLPVHYRDLIVRVYLCNEPQAQVAQDLGTTLQALRNMLTRAKVKLSGELDRLQRRA